MTRVTGTYRLQLHPQFGFDDAADQVPYLSRLGVSHLYLSPILATVPGSMHGYDVLDHTRLNPELGGEPAFRRLADTADRHGLGLIVDIVPNHMALTAPQWANAPLWQVLSEGPTSPAAHWFDVDWAALEGRFGLPTLGRDLPATLAAGELVLDTGTDDEGPAAGRPVIRYYDHVLPVAEGTLGTTDPAHAHTADVLSRQHYRLASWRDADTVLNYRRFFEVDTLIGVRVEEPDVFEATHALLLELHHEGLIDGFRVDHPDGLADPEGYLQTLREHCRPGTPIWVEKILEGQEDLPTSWATAGTTGYDALQAVQSALVDPVTASAVTSCWTLVGGRPDPRPVIAASKRQVVAELLQPEVGRLHRRACEALPHQDPGPLREALTELLVGIEVYRAYIRPGADPTPGALAHLRGGAERALQARPGLAEPIHRLTEIARAPERFSRHVRAATDFAVRLQQTCGPVMAKGIEDTAFYRWHRLVALNEVGGDPSTGHHPRLEWLHIWADRQQTDWPAGMTTLSTHDTKRSEDVRARLLAVAGDEPAWAGCTRAFAEAAAQHGVDPPTAHLLWQTLVGTWPISRERLEEYLLKAVREAKDATAWVDGDPDYEQRVLQLATRALQRGPMRHAVQEALERNPRAIRATILAAKLLQLCLPGVPDTYQGGELVALSLVDPDNRRPVDYARRAARLARLDAGSAAHTLDDEKLLVTSRALRLRRERPELFGEHAAYAPVESHGGHAAGFRRGEDVVVVVTRAPNDLEREGGWSSERVDLPDGEWHDRLTGRRLDGGAIECADLFAALPVALLVRR